jgi:beta-lactamase class A
MLRSHRLRTLILVGVATFVAGLLAGGATIWRYDRQSESSPLSGIVQRESRQGALGLINPLLECDVPVEMSELNYFEDKAQDLVGHLIASGKADSVSVYFRDMNNGQWFGINEREPFLPASLFKLPVLIAYLKIAEHDPSILKQRYTMTATALRTPAHNIPHPQRLVVGKSYAVEDLLRQMIVLSDNQATNLLIHDYEAHFARPFRDLGIPVPSNDNIEDYIDAKTYASFFRILYNASYLSDEMSEAALRLLSESEFRHGLVEGVPAGVKVSHKYGEWVVDRPKPEPPLVQFHDCGIVYYPKRPYLLCVMSRGDDVAELIGAIRDISKTVYQAVDAQKTQ